MMPGLFDAIGPLLFAQEAPQNAFDPSLLIMPLGVVFLLYFLILRPNSEQEKKRKAMIAGLKKNDRVVTAGGIHGVVVSVDAAAGQILLRVDDEKGVRVKVDRGSIVRVVEAE